MSSADTAPIQTPTLPAGGWRVVPGDSELSFETRILFGLIAVRGSYSDYAGELHVGADGDARGELRIEAATVSTGIKRRDAHLRSADFFHVEEHPHVRFQLASLEPGADGSLILIGTLYVRGEQLPIVAPVSVESVAPERLRVSAELDVDHRASGLRALGSGWKKVPEKLHVHAAIALERAS